MKIPLSWLQLSHEKWRLIVAIAGITFADVLMFMQLGFRDALFDSSVRLHKSLDGDIFLLNSKSETFTDPTHFSQRRLYELVGLPEVKTVAPIYFGFGIWKNPIKRNNRRILIIGINPVRNLINFPGVAENLDTIKQQDVAIFDQLSRAEFGPVKEEFMQGKTVSTEVANRRISIGGLFSMGTSFGADGNLITSDVNFFRLFPNQEKGLVNMGIVQLNPGINVDAALQKIKNRLSNKDVVVLSKQQLIDREKRYWSTRTTIGFVFAFGTVMGFIVGTVIVYQILYTDVNDHLPEYATLKAMGYTDFYLLSIVFQEALILACIGYLPGFSMAIFLYLNVSKATGLPLVMTAARAIQILIMTVIMCCISGAIAVGKLRAADPADIF
jgi:putative ABC transport system permease protein